jgi:hypothetical protein
MRICDIVVSCGALPGRKALSLHVAHLVFAAILADEMLRCVGT